MATADKIFENRGFYPHPNERIDEEDFLVIQYPEMVHIRTGIAVPFIIVIIFLTLGAGCVDVFQASQGLTPAGANATANDSLKTGFPASPPHETTAATPGPTPRARYGTRTLQNIIRGEPFTIEGTVPDRSVTHVQVWMLNGTISTTLIPVLPDGSYRYILDRGQTATLSRTYSWVVIVHFPAPPDHFGVTLDNATGDVMGLEHGTMVLLYPAGELASFYPSTLVDYLEKEITRADRGDSCEAYFLNGKDAWIAIDPIDTIQPGSLLVTGTTNLPLGTPLSLSVTTTNLHPTPKVYDWSHEIAQGNTAVTRGTGRNNSFSGRVDTSLLNSGKYFVMVESGDEAWQSDAVVIVDLVAPENPQTNRKNWIDWDRLALPPLQVNESIVPILPDGAWRIVPPGTGTRNSDLPFGSILYCASDGICRGFDRNGTQFLAVYNSNEARTMEVPNGAMVDSGRMGNVTFVELGGNLILTRIDEYS